MEMPALPYPSIPLSDNRIRVRRWQLDDVDCIREAGQDPRILRGTTVPAEYSLDEGRAFIERQWGRAEAGFGISQAIATADTHQAIGLIIIALRPQANVAGLGYWIIPSARGRGIAASAVRLVLPWAFAQLHLQRIEAWVETDNPESRSVLRSAGLQHEGTLRSFLRLDDLPVDVDVFAMTDLEYRARR
jgi:RimJ/RimL family protein N-acetyltransferase